MLAGMKLVGRLLLWNARVRADEGSRIFAVPRFKKRKLLIRRSIPLASVAAVGAIGWVEVALVAVAAVGVAALVGGGGGGSVGGRGGGLGWYGLEVWEIVVNRLFMSVRYAFFLNRF